MLTRRLTQHADSVFSAYDRQRPCAGLCLNAPQKTGDAPHVPKRPSPQEAATISPRRAVFSDVDGTLLNSAHRVTALTRGAVHALAERGVPFVPISARSPSGLAPILKKNRFCCPVVCYSGGLILAQDGRVLFQKGLSPARAREILRYLEAQRFDLTACAYSFDRWLVKDREDPRIVREERIVGARSVQGPLPESSIHKLLCICGPQQLPGVEAALRRAFPEEAIVASSENLLEIMASDVSKAAAVKLLCGLWGINMRDAVAFGDHYNDEEMLRAVGCGFLMQNAPESLRQAFERTAPDNDHDGIYHALRGLKMI